MVMTFFDEHKDVDCEDQGDHERTVQKKLACQNNAEFADRQRHKLIRTTSKVNNLSSRVRKTYLIFHA